MGKRVLLIQGHPDPAGGHFCHALGDAYASSAASAGHEVRTLAVAGLDFPLVRNAAQWEAEPPPRAIAEAQDALRWAQHLVLVFPLWLGDMPALLKGFLEQTLRPGFAIARARPNKLGPKLLKGRSARIVVTMGMPALFYRVYYRSHSLKSLKRNVLEFCGISPVRTSLIGMVEAKDARQAWLHRLGALGAMGG
jgi:putative NADPH-quinone reductase